MVLVTAAILLSRSLLKLHSFDAGFTREQVVLADVDLTGARLAPEARERAFADLLERLRGAGRVQSASLSSRTPIDFSSQLRRIDVHGFEATPRNGVSSNTVTPGYFHTFGLNVGRGRGFTVDDRRESPARRGDQQRHGAALFRRRRSDRPDLRAQSQQAQDDDRRRGGRCQAREPAHREPGAHGLPADVADERGPGRFRHRPQSAGPRRSNGRRCARRRREPPCRRCGRSATMRWCSTFGR